MTFYITGRSGSGSQTMEAETATVAAIYAEHFKNNGATSVSIRDDANKTYTEAEIKQMAAAERT